MATSETHYQKPGPLTSVFNAGVKALTHLGVGVWGARTLEVQGRRSGLPRRTPVNLLTIDGRKYLVAPRGETEWVRNVRASGRLALLLRRRRQEWVAAEITDPNAKVPILRAYLKRWRMEVGVFFGGVSAASSDDELRAIASRHPVFALTEAGA